MEKISEQHRDIREGHSKMREEFEAFKSKCDQLRKETEIVLRRTARTQIKLALMARILKAKEQADLDTAAHLTQLLREIVERENEEEEEEVSEDS
ncbi:hypothetical protein CCACVL1_29391 [Corchorus capsularis]|uniref:Uncharacterized protein n=1 Tax=Corchorus capsularis TaxID=210143 RepID=A0A1R3G1V8_COCAP|nr:hypothetical protein CCACVL1_29391 [Corchorus capsularis]